MDDPAGERLGAARDALVRDLRALARSVAERIPEDVEVRGILERVGPLLAGQEAALDRVSALDLDRRLGPEGFVEALEGALEAFERLMRLPRMIEALARVLEQETRSRALAPAAEEARALAARVERLVGAWLRRNAG